jgi:hypothetical protein
MKYVDHFQSKKVQIVERELGNHFIQTFKPMTGDALFHEGGIPHITFPLYSGRRTNMVVWLTRKNNQMVGL